MSITDKLEDKEVQFTPLTSLNIDGDDCRNIRDFYSHFNIDMPAELKTSLEAFEEALAKESFDKDELVNLQNKLRASLCGSIISSNHPFFNDHLMDEIRSNAQQIAFLSSFDEQVQEVLDKSKT